MSKDKLLIKQVRIIYGIVLGISIAVAAICIMGACINIYTAGGEEPYSRASVAANFLPIAKPVYICLALIIGSFVLNFFCPAEKKTDKPDTNYDLLLNKLYAKIDLSKADTITVLKIDSLKQNCTTFKTISALLLLIGSFVFLLRSANVVSKLYINDAIIKSMLIMLPCLGIPCGFIIFTAYYIRGAKKKELELVKEALASGAKNQGLQESDLKTEQGKKLPTGNALLITRCVLVVLGIAILIYGFIAGGTADVLTKAVNICTECVGLG